MILGRTVYDASGATLLTAGTILQSQYISRLCELGYPALYVRSPHDTSDFDLAEPVRQETRIRIQASLQDLANNVSSKGASTQRFRIVGELVGELVDELLSNGDLLLSIAEIRSFDSYTFVHSVNTCVLSVMAAMSIGYDRSKLVDLGVGALLHDLGKMFIPSEILNKPAALSRDEFETVKTHTQRGYALLRDQINLLSAHVAYQHHERCDGNGYPRGLKDEDIIPFAKLVAVADSFDAMTSDRVYSTAMFPDEAAGTLLSEAPERYDQSSVTAVVRCVAVHPVGSVVVLDTGEIGEVCRATRTETHVMITTGSRQGWIVNCPSEARITRRKSWKASESA
jgi:HD-GYP domain-containing protein (c-di-GMP phosphodiesterase class II)